MSVEPDLPAAELVKRLRLVARYSKDVEKLDNVPVLLEQAAAYIETSDKTMKMSLAVLPDDRIKQMVQRFLSWELPEHFRPDCGISFKPTYNNGTAEGGRCRPVGTNLFDAEQAEAMVRFLLAGG